MMLAWSLKRVLGERMGSASWIEVGFTVALLAVLAGATLRVVRER